MTSRTASPGAAFASLSSNDAIQFIIADIPLYAVGILAFGTFTFFFLMKRVDRWIFCLHLSVIIAFLAALLDLSQILIRGRLSGNDPVPADVSNLVTAREVFYAFANGLRFLFYWGFVATIPLGETIPQGNSMHSGSWRRWGVIGTILKWSSLLIILLMTIFQLIFRNVSAFEQIGPVYEAEAALEIILSAVFILKLLLNTWARFPVSATTQTTGRMLVQYAPIIVALLFSLWIAVGNVVLFEFTETALGRFMRAVELYIVVIYMLTISFHHLRHLSFFPVYRPALRSNTLKRNSIGKGPEVIMAQVASEPTKVDLAEVLQERYRSEQVVPATVERNSARSAKVENAGAHQSMAARMSTWLSMARPLPRLPHDQHVQPWDVDSERGPSPVEQAIITPWYANGKVNPEPLALPPVLDEDERRGVSPFPNFSPVSQTGDGDPVATIVGTKQRPASATPAATVDAEPEKTPVPTRDWQEIEYSNAVRYSGVSQDILADALRQKNYQGPEDSPFGSHIQVVPPQGDEELSRPNSLEGGQYATSPYPLSPLASAAATPLARSRPLPPMPVSNSILNSPMSPLPPDSARSSNMSILLRRQTELDESIAALRLFSPSKQVFDINVMPVNPAVYNEQTQYATVPQSQGNGGLSPIPSVGTTAEYPSPSPDVDQIPQSSRQKELPFEHTPPLNRLSKDSGVMPVPARQENEPIRPASSSNKLAPPRVPISRFSDSSSVGDHRERRVDSNGTQYDITSFVGNLTAPVNPKDSLLSAASAALSEEGSVNVATIRQLPAFARPTLITQLPRQDESVAEDLTVPATTPTMRRTLPPTPQPAPQNQSAPRFRRAVGLPARPRLGLEAVNLTPVEEKVTSPSDTATLVTSPQSGSGTPMTGKAW